jgi:hypothetical protein
MTVIATRSRGWRKKRELVEEVVMGRGRGRGERGEENGERRTGRGGRGVRCQVISNLSD